MAEIEMTLPTVQYGNVKVRATPEELGIGALSNADQVGIVTAIYLNLFTQGFKTGAQMDVSAPASTSQDEDMVKAHELLSEGLGGVTELPEYKVGDSVEVAGMTFTKRSEVPWDQKVDAKKKPWETGETAIKAVSEDW